MKFFDRRDFFLLENEENLQGKLISNEESIDSSVFEGLSKLPKLNLKSFLQNIPEIKLNTFYKKNKKEKLTRSKSQE